MEWEYGSLTVDSHPLVEILAIGESHCIAKIA